ncbi:MAG: DUF1566 domain-containing protein [Bacteroidales bacterium]|nr:DUF1566 domain-containing protein [Bacteroidales bacterium]
MKKIYALFCFVLITMTLVAQAPQTPQKMSYQAVIRNSSNALVNSTSVGMRISILQGSESGTAVYVETQTPTTNANGLVTIEIGGGTPVSGTFTGIDWSAGPYFIKTETATAPPLTTYTITGTSQLLSVPFALYAKTAAGYTETDPVYSAWNKSTGINITSSQVSDFATSVAATPAVVANTAKNSYPAADATKLAAITGTNTGDETGATIRTKLGITTLSGSNTGDQTLAGLGGVASNPAITGATRTKITYDTKGLVTAGADATTADIAASANKNYVTDAQLTVLGNTTGVNSGDNAINTLYSGLVTNATHTGDATGATALTVSRINGTSLAGLTTGILKNTTGTGIPSIAVAGTDYLAPNGSAALLTNFPTLNQNTTGSAASFTGSLAGEVTGTQGATIVGNAAVLGKVLTGYVSGAGTITASDNILQAIQKLNGNNATNANLTGMVTSVGNVTTVVTNANLTGEVTSVGNATTVSNAAVLGKLLTGYTSGAGTVAASDNILQAIQKLNGNINALVTSNSHYLGEEFDGGIIFHIYKTSDGVQHGLIVNKGESGMASLAWQNAAVSTGATSTWNGASNTTSMTDSPAAAYCISLGAGWYMPSIDELNILYNNRYYVNKAIAGGVTGTLLLFTDYWSSTEVDLNQATSFYFGEGRAYIGAKTGLGNIRAIKAF